MSTLLGHAAVEELLSSPPGSEPQLIGMKDNRVTRQPLMQCVEKTLRVAECVKSGDYAEGDGGRGRSFEAALRTLRTVVRALPHPPRRGAEASPLRAHAWRGARSRHEHRRPRCRCASPSIAATTCSACATASGAWSRASSSRWAG